MHRRLCYAPDGQICNIDWEAPMSGSFDGKHVVVTDAADFMGPDVTAAFTEAGADVIADRRDLTVPTAAGDLIREAGRVDVLIVNLTFSHPGRLAHEIGDDEMAHAFGRLVFPLHRLVRAVLPQMIERRQGKIIVVGSADALRGKPRRAAYGAARGAQHAYIRNVGIEVAPHNVQINATGQTFVENPTYFSPEYQKTDEFRKRLEQVPTGRLATGREAAALILFLAGPSSDFFVGQVFPFAGGWVV
jgi:2-keto-3-deoxy-L-fuconate dehydrogenase